MDIQQVRRRVPNIKFRVLIIGRANAGKTSILQRVCDTTQSPEIYRVSQGNRERVQLNATTECGQHNIDDELIFTNHEGYVFHDSRGFESGSANELKTVQRFVREKSQKRRLKNRLHAIWYCIPMDNQRPSLDLKHFNDVCPDQNVPVIAVFTKYDQFKRNVKMKLEDEGCPCPETELGREAEKMFHNFYLSELEATPNLKFVQLERMHKCGEHCTELIETTANALNSEVVALMLLAVQRGNLELNIKYAVKACTGITEVDKYKTKIVRKCLLKFPSLWVG